MKAPKMKSPTIRGVKTPFASSVMKKASASQPSSSRGSRRGGRYGR